MSLPIYPSIDSAEYGVRGLEWPVTRAPLFSTKIQEVSSGKEFRTSWWTYPKYQYTISYSVLIDEPNNLWMSNDSTDLQTIMGFFLQQQGSFAPFLLYDPNDNTVQGQTIGTGDGSTTEFQLVRTYGGYTEAVQAVVANAVINIYLNGAPVAPAYYSIGDTGILTLVNPPGDGVLITGDYSFYWPVLFVEDQLAFDEFMYQLWSCHEVKFISVKL